MSARTRLGGVASASSEAGIGASPRGARVYATPRNLPPARTTDSEGARDPTPVYAPSTSATISSYGSPEPQNARATGPPQTHTSVRKVPKDLAPYVISRTSVRLGRFIAAGAHSRVYEGELSSSEGRPSQTVAIKMTLARTSELTLESLKEGRALDPAEYDAAAQALLDEGLLLSQLRKHTHVVAFVGVVVDDQGVMLVMEFISRTTVADLYVANAQERAKKSWAFLVQICVEVASALEFLHSQEPPVLHVDVAARNVLIDAAGMARLADFGLARRYMDSSSELSSAAVDWAAAVSSVSRGAELAAAAAAASGGGGAGLESGSEGEALPLRIVAPEVLNDAVRGFSRASDTFAFGMLMYEVLVGATPWGRGADPLIIARLAVRGARPPLPPPPLLDDKLASLIEECWCHEPALRPPMQAVRWQLQEWLVMHSADRAIQEPFGAAEAAASAAYVNEVAAAEILAETVVAKGARRGGRDAGGPGEYAVYSDSREDDAWGADGEDDEAVEEYALTHGGGVGW